jgi:hypothetical protein
MLSFYDLALFDGEFVAAGGQLMYLIPVSTPGNEADTAMHPKASRIGGR